jgi:hypothetical protein
MTRRVVAIHLPVGPEMAAAGPFALAEGAAFGDRREAPNRAFAGPRNRLSGALKNRRKTLFIQQVADRDFALGAWPLSWHK